MVVVCVSLMLLWPYLDLMVEPLHLANAVTKVACSDTGFKWQDLRRYSATYSSKGFCCTHCSADGANLKLRW